MRISRTPMIPAAVALVVLTLAACNSGGSSNSASAPPAPAATTAAGHSAASSSVAASAAASPARASSASVSKAPPGAPSDRCRLTQLQLSLGRASGAAGTDGFPVVFTNTGAQACVLDGFPGVSYANGPGGAPVGAPAIRQGDTHAPVRLAPGAQASALVLAVNVQNYPTQQCAPVPVTGLRIFPPNDYDSVFVQRRGTACSRPTPVTGQLKVGPVVAGASAGQ